MGSHVTLGDLMSSLELVLGERTVAVNDAYSVWVCTREAWDAATARLGGHTWDSVGGAYESLRDSIPPPIAAPAGRDAGSEADLARLVRAAMDENTVDDSVGVWLGYTEQPG